MALSLREQSTISRRIKANTATLTGGSVSLRDQSKLSRELKTDVALLSGDTNTVDSGNTLKIGDRVVITKYERLGSSDEKLQGRTGEIVKSHFDGWYVQLDLKGKEQEPKVELILTGLNDKLEKIDGETIEPEGKENQVKTAKGTKINTGFTVIEATKLITSHDEAGKPNPEYPQELQPRDRARDTSQAQIAKIANNLDPDLLGLTRVAYQGAPIIGKDRVVESGNGRAIAINLAYKLGKANEYRDWLLEVADMYGISRSKIERMKRPVLVRVRTSDVDRVQFAMEANQSDMLAMTATEKAKSDANRLNDSLMSRLSGDGDLNSLANRDFIMDFLKSLGESEAAQYSTTDGTPTKQLYDRVQAALFAKAYNDDRLLQMMADSEKVEIANTIKALNQAAPHFIRARSVSHKVTDGITRQVGDAVELSLDDQAVNALIEATNVLKKAKDSGMNLEEFLKQTNVFGEMDDIDPVVAQMAIFIKENNRSSNRMGMAFQTMAEFVADELERRQNQSLFVDDPEISLVDVLKAANERLKTQFGSEVKTIGGGAGGFIDMFTETRGQKQDREVFLAEQQKPSPPFSNPIYEKKLNDLIEFWDRATELAKTDKLAKDARTQSQKYGYILWKFHDTGEMDGDILEKIKDDDRLADNPNVKTLIKVKLGMHDALNSEELLDLIETAANAIDADIHNDLINEAMDKWLEVDNRIYLLDSVNYVGDTSGIMGWFDNTDFEPDYAYDIDENEGILDAARRLKFNKKTDHWVTTETGSHLMIRGGKVVGGAGGKLNGSRKRDNSESMGHREAAEYWKGELKNHKKALSRVVEDPTMHKDSQYRFNDPVSGMNKTQIEHFINKIPNHIKHHESMANTGAVLDSITDTSNIAGWFDNSEVA